MTTIWDCGTIFDPTAERFWLARLCGLPVGREGVDNGPAATRGVAGTGCGVRDQAGARVNSARGAD